MGLNADKWCAKLDVLIEGCPWARKVVDDTIIWAEDRQQLERRIRMVLEKCTNLNMTDLKKEIRDRTVNQICRSHYFQERNFSRQEQIRRHLQIPDAQERQGSAIFLRASSAIRFLHSWAHLMAKIRPLLTKGTALLWQEEHEEAFIKAKQTLIEKTTVVPFDPKQRKSIVLTATNLASILQLLQSTRHPPWARLGLQQGVKRAGRSSNKEQETRRKPKASHSMLEKHETPERVQPRWNVLGQSTAPQVAHS